MEHFPYALTREQTSALIDRIESGFDRNGFGLWALERSDTSEMIGYTGLVNQTFDAHFTPAVEIGWRLAKEHWGRGYATEAARAALHFGFTEAGLGEIVSFTVPANVRSTAVMKRLGMERDPADDFDNPFIPEGSPLRRHVLYRLTVERWGLAVGSQ
jgi:ribosomal-protein-alanine N-acetyltransferase